MPSTMNSNRTAAVAPSRFKDLNVVYDEERNRDEGYWSSTSGSSEESDSGVQRNDGLRNKRTKVGSSARTAAVDFRLDTQAQARQEWLWATGQLGVEPEVPRAVTPVVVPQVKVVPACAVSTRSSEVQQIKTSSSDAEVVQVGVTEVKETTAKLPSPLCSTTPATDLVGVPVSSDVVASTPSPVTNAAALVDDRNKFYSLEWLEKDEFERAQAQWIESDFEKPFNAEMEMKEARRRAALRYYRQQNQPSQAVLMGDDHSASGGKSEFIQGVDTVVVNTDAGAVAVGNILGRFNQQEDEWAYRQAKQQMFATCAESLETLIRSDKFINRIQRFLKKHHRSLLSTKVMRDAGEFCHEDHALFVAYVTEMEGVVMKALHDGAATAKRRERAARRARKKAMDGGGAAPAHFGGYAGSGVSGVTASGVNVVVSLEDDDGDFDDEDDGGVRGNGAAVIADESEFVLDFDEEEFFDYLFSANSEGDDGDDGGIGGVSGRDILSFEAWEALLSILHFSSFIDLVDEYVAAEYGLDDMEVREDSKAARKRGLPTASGGGAQSGGTPPPSPLEPTGASSSASTPVRVSGGGGGFSSTAPVTATTPSPPRGTAVSAAGSGAAMRKLLPSSNGSTGNRQAFTSTVGASRSGSQSGTTTANRAPSSGQGARVGAGISMLARSANATAPRAPGSAPSSTKKKL